VIPPAIRLNLGVGDDWMGNDIINIDSRVLIPPADCTYLRADIADLSDMFADGAAVEIWAHDVLEHFPQAKGGAVLDEWVRLLAPGGILHLKTPALDALARFILNPFVTTVGPWEKSLGWKVGDRWPDRQIALQVYGGQDYPDNFHRAGYTIALLQDMLEARGLEIVSSGYEGTSNLTVTARKTARGARFDGIKRVENLDRQMMPYYSPKDDYAQKADHPGHSGNYYEWYYSYTQALKPQTVLEIGCLYGYSSIAMVMGHPAIQRLYLFDCGAYGVPLAVGVANIARLFRGTIIGAAKNTQELTALDLPELIDLIHVDGDHSARGLLHDLALVLPCLAPRGVIVVDDVTNCPELRGACADFAAAQGLVSQFIPTYRGHVLLSRPDGGAP
jgi:predicted O-methyltransferase YrrM